MTLPSAIVEPYRTAHQIVNAKGEPYQAIVTSNLWVSDPGRFANKTEGNSIKAFTTGKAYFAELVETVMAAQSQVLIAGWQVSWDAIVAPPKMRFFDLIYNAAKANPNLLVCVMPWDDTEPVQTYDDETLRALNDINERLGRKQVRVLLSPSYASTNAKFFSHHQKQVVVDARIAFLGGMDICYGRFDDEHFEVCVAKGADRQGMNRYNGCIAPVGIVDPSLAVNPDLLTGGLDTFGLGHGYFKSSATVEREKLYAGGWQIKYKQAGTIDIADNASKTASNHEDSSTLDRFKQPRMPWQDVHCRIEGPAVDDLLRNFVGRWNIKAEKGWQLPMPGWGDASACKQPKPGQAHIQVLRSAPANHCAKEHAALANKQGTPKPGGTQHDIYSAMIKLIEKSMRFIYIENQFFVSGFGEELRQPPHNLSAAGQFIQTYGGKDQQSSAAWTARSDDKTKVVSRLNTRAAIEAHPTNLICEALIKRIQNAIFTSTRPAFHVYITLPVHPEGLLSDASVAAQVYWTMQTISFGSKSLLTGIRRAIKARELRDAKDEGFMRVLNENNSEYKSVPLEKCDDYVTLLNLRSWGKTEYARIVTEQVYVHSKCMIVDDLYALIGSANINDRSMLGERDSELAVLVMDGENTRADINGKGSQRPVRVFAHELRKSLWKKLFGITSGRSPASELAQAIEEPGCPDSWKLIQSRARKNAAAFEAVFPWVPKDWSGFKDRKDKPFPASILPPWNPTLPSPEVDKWPEGNLNSPMPFEPRFWQSEQHNAQAVAQLNAIKGFITALPIRWTDGENLHFNFSTALLTQNESLPHAPDSDGGGTSVASAQGPGNREDSV